MKVTLKQTANDLNEVVVTGYTTPALRLDLTGAVSVVHYCRHEDLSPMPTP
jgi:hypothetical protein